MKTISSLSVKQAGLKTLGNRAVKAANQRLAKAIAIATYSAVSSVLLIAQSAVAVPQEANFDANGTGATYGNNASQGTLTIVQDNSVVRFGGTGAGSGVNVDNGQTLTFTHSGGNSDWSVLVKDVNAGGNVSVINGLLNGNVRAIIVNQNGIIFGQNAQVDMASLVASTHNIDDLDFAAGNYTFSANPNDGNIIVEGLQSSLAGAQIALISNNIRIDGSVNITGGDLNLIAGQAVVVSYANNNLMQFDITDALQTTDSDTAISVSANGEISAANVNIRSWVTDPRSFAINNSGVVRAEGIDTSTPGVVRLIGTGGKVRTTGTIDVAGANGDGSIEMSAGIVQIGGVIDAGTGALDVTIGDGVTVGSFEMLEQTTATLGSIAIDGQGVVNVIRGLANYQVDGLNSGTAGFNGVGPAGADVWANTGRITFSNVGGLFATSETENTIEILDTGSLNQPFGNLILGSVTGGGLNDTFIIGGAIQTADGLGGQDSFQLDGGSVAQSIDGGADIDTVSNVFNPELVDENNNPDPNGFNGSSDFVAAWSNIETVIENQLPPVDPDPVDPVDPGPVVPAVDPTPAVIVPNLPLVDINDPSNVSLGLVGEGNNLRLPCGHNGDRDLLTKNERLAKDEEDCFNQYGGEEYQQLLSSIIHFDNNSYAITSASADRLNRVSAFVVESKMFDRVVMSGHTDSNASEAYNDKLSERRVNATGDYMQNQGVDSDLFEKHHFGESLPAKLNDTNENRAYNRRVHIDLKR